MLKEAPVFVLSSIASKILFTIAYFNLCSSVLVLTVTLSSSLSPPSPTLAKHVGGPSERSVTSVSSNSSVKGSFVASVDESCKKRNKMTTSHSIDGVEKHFTCLISLSSRTMSTMNASISNEMPEPDYTLHVSRIQNIAIYNSFCNFSY